MSQNFQHGLAHNAYRSAAITTSPLAAIVMLYDTAIARLGRTVTLIEGKQFEEAFINLERAVAILRGLCHNLDFEKGGAFAERMRDTYLALIMSALGAFRKPDAPARFKRLIEALTGLRDAWADVRVQMAQKKFTSP